MECRHAMKSLPKLEAPLIRAPPLLSDYCGVKDLRIKDCSKTITGTMKDFRSLQLIRHFERHFDFVLVYQITYGNAGYSMGVLCDMYNRAAGARKFYPVNIVDKNLDPGIKSKLSEVSEVIEIDLREKVLRDKDLEHIVRAGRSIHDICQHDSGEGFLINPEVFGALFPHLGLYHRLVREVAKEPADLIMMPIGSGELYFNFLTFHPFGPLLMENPHFESRIQGACVSGNAFARGSDPSKLADKLVTPVSYFRKMSAVMCFLKDPEIDEAYRVLRDAGIAAEPSAATAFAALRSQRLRDDARVIVVNTGCGLFQSKISP